MFNWNFNQIQQVQSNQFYKMTTHYQSEQFVGADANCQKDCKCPKDAASKLNWLQRHKNHIIISQADVLKLILLKQTKQEKLKKIANQSLKNIFQDIIKSLQTLKNKLSKDFQTEFSLFNDDNQKDLQMIPYFDDLKSNVIENIRCCDIHSILNKFLSHQNQKHQDNELQNINTFFNKVQRSIAQNINQKLNILLNEQNNKIIAQMIFQTDQITLIQEKLKKSIYKQPIKNQKMEIKFEQKQTFNGHKEIQNYLQDIAGQNQLNSSMNSSQINIQQQRQQNSFADSYMSDESQVQGDQIYNYQKALSLQRQKQLRLQIQREKFQKQKGQAQRQKQKVQRQRQYRQRQRQYIQKLQTQKLRRQKLEKQKIQRQKLQKQKFQRINIQRQQLQRQKVQRQKHQRQKLQRQKLQRQKYQRQINQRQKIERQIERQNSLNYEQILRKNEQNRHNPNVQIQKNQQSSFLQQLEDDSGLFFKNLTQSMILHRINQDRTQVELVEYYPQQIDQSFSTIMGIPSFERNIIERIPNDRKKIENIPSQSANLALMNHLMNRIGNRILSQEQQIALALFQSMKDHSSGLDSTASNNFGFRNQSKIKSIGQIHASPQKFLQTKQKFQVVVKIVALFDVFLYQFKTPQLELKNYFKMKILVGDTTGCAVMFIQYNQYIKPNQTIHFKECSLSDYKNNYQIQTNYTVRSLVNKQISINEDVKLSCFSTINLKPPNKLKQRWNYTLSSKNYIKIYDSINMFIKQKTNQLSLRNKSIMVYLIQRLGNQKFVVGDYSARIILNIDPQHYNKNKKFNVITGDSLIIISAIITQSKDRRQDSHYQLHTKHEYCKIINVRVNNIVFHKDLIPY